MYLLGKNVSFPNINEWHAKGIRTKSGLLFAPEDFIVSYDYSKDRAYFSWQEAKAFEEKVLYCEGWRLPTADEWTRLITEESPDFLRYELSLGLHGYITREYMYDYRRLLSPTGKRYAGNLGHRGYYWSSTESGDDTALSLIFGNTLLKSDQPAICVVLKEYGRSIRCVEV